MNLPIQLLRVVATVFLTASITVVGSERMFWFWSPGLSEHLVLVLFYAVPVGVTLWTIGRYRVDGLWPLLLATPIYAYLTEGWITPVLYSGGPFVPFFPAWFSAWHGMLGFVLLWYAIRRLLLVESWKPLLSLCAGVGVFWGVWSSTLRLPENVNDQDLVGDLGELTVLDPSAFLVYVATFTAILAASHWLLGVVWPRSFVVPRWTARTVAVVVVVGVVGWSFVVPWALPMFAGYVALQRWGLRRHLGRARRDGSGDLFEQMVGRIRIRALWPLLACVPAAAWTYWALWALDPSDHVLGIVMYSTIGVQTVIGGVYTVRALRRSAIRSANGEPMRETVASTTTGGRTHDL